MSLLLKLFQGVVLTILALPMKFLSASQIYQFKQKLMKLSLTKRILGKNKKKPQILVSEDIEIA
jgi:hypothetical protein